MIPPEWLKAASERLAGKIHRTPLTHDAERGLYIKWENKQKTGSFKVRGALNKSLILEDWEREMGLVTASAGNHGQGVALAGQIIGAEARVFVSEDAPIVKIEAMRKLGAKIELVEGGYHEAEEAGLVFTKRNDAVWISPYNDGHVIAGQGTIASEILEEVPETAEMTWVVPLSGGGLLSGIGAVLGNQAQNAHVIGVQVKSAAFMHGLFYKGTQAGIQDLPTLADGLAGAVEDKSITIPLIKNYVDEVVLVSEAKVAEAIAFAWKEYGEKIEGAGAVGLAAVLSKKVPQEPSVVIISGGNIQPEIHAEILARYEE
ncbi:MAG: pyridoxal-phosphate dependent enzyme [Anaerolineae bacterium]|jgi:threonine dehydratase|nr:pyridoxal-phosphate dependent enzyme [Anaerolineae bacterium]MBT7073779.1 pyridoxal-phosphate dependent enzyme [Anaerolineae bacterium]MBT7782769.1 pyridoxal-phosphate dependent enzyme [Anaerolineae bacterium]